MAMPRCAQRGPQALWLLLAACAAAPAAAPEVLAAPAQVARANASLPIVLAHVVLPVTVRTTPRCDLCRDAAAFAVSLRTLGLADPFAPAPWRADTDVLVVVAEPGQGVPPVALSVCSEEGVDVVTLAPSSVAAAPSTWAHFVVLARRPCQLAVVWREPGDVGERTLRVFGRDV